MAGTSVVHWGVSGLGHGGGKDKIHACVKLILSDVQGKCVLGKQVQRPKGHQATQALGRNGGCATDLGVAPRQSAPASHLSSMEVPSSPREGVSARLGKAPVTVPFPPEEGTLGGRGWLLKRLQQGQHGDQ